MEFFLSARDAQFWVWVAFKSLGQKIPEEEIRGTFCWFYDILSFGFQLTSVGQIGWSGLTPS